MPPALASADPDGPRAGRLALPLALAAAIALFVALGLLLQADLVDDAFIFLRYARNFARGEGLVFNPGERVQGYTSFLWTLLLGLLAKAGLGGPAPARWLSAACAAGAMAATLRLSLAAHREAPRLAHALPLALLATCPSFIWWGFSGMATALFTLLLVGFADAFVRRIGTDRPLALPGVWAALAALSRPEAMVLLPLGLGAALRGPASAARRWRRVGTFLAPWVLVAAYLAWQRAYYGAWVPNTYFAKAAIPLALRLERGLGYTAGFAGCYAAPLVIVVLAFRLGLGRALARPRGAGLLLALLGCWAALVTWLGGDHLPLFRFCVPLLPLLFVLPVGLFSSSSAAPAGRGRVAAAALSLVVAVNLLGPRAPWALLGQAPVHVEMARQWAGVGRWLRAHLPRDAQIATVASGATPYYADLRTLDLVGLNDAEIARHGDVYPGAAPGHYKYYTPYVLARAPDVIVFPTSGLFRERPVLSLDRVPRHYAYAIYDLLRRAETHRAYRYRAEQMADGTYLEYLERRPTIGR